MLACTPAQHLDPGPIKEQLLYMSDECMALDLKYNDDIL